MLDFIFGLKGRVVLILQDINRVENFSNQLSTNEAGISWGGKFLFRLRFSIFGDRRSVWTIKIIALLSPSQSILLPSGKMNPAVVGTKRPKRKIKVKISFLLEDRPTWRSPWTWWWGWHGPGGRGCSRELVAVLEVMRMVGMVGMVRMVKIKESEWQILRWG